LQAEDVADPLAVDVYRYVLKPALTLGDVVPKAVLDEGGVKKGPVAIDGDCKISQETLAEVIGTTRVSFL